MLIYQEELAAYNNWLSSKIEIVGEHSWKPDQTGITEGVDYRIEYQINHSSPMGKSTQVARQIKREEIMSQAAPINETDVASHSCTVGNSIEQERRYTLKDLKAAHYAGWYNGLVNAYRHDFSWKEYSQSLLTNQSK